MVGRNKVSSVFFLFVFLNGLPAFGADFSLDWGHFSRDITLSNKNFSGEWSDSKELKSHVCKKSGYDYKAKMAGTVENIQFEVVSQKVLNVDGTLVNLKGNVNGNYKTKYSLCKTVSPHMSMAIDRIHVRANAVLSGERSTKINVKVLSTEFGTIHFGSSSSPTVEKFVTKAVNATLRGVWSSFLGEWLSDRFSDIINEKIKDPSDLL